MSTPGGSTPVIAVMSTSSLSNPDSLVRMTASVIWCTPYPSTCSPVNRNRATSDHFKQRFARRRLRGLLSTSLTAGQPFKRTFACLEQVADESLVHAERDAEAVFGDELGAGDQCQPHRTPA